MTAKGMKTPSPTTCCLLRCNPNRMHFLKNSLLQSANGANNLVREGNDHVDTLLISQMSARGRTSFSVSMNRNCVGRTSAWG